MSKLWKFVAAGCLGAFALAGPAFSAANGGNENHGGGGYDATYDAAGQWDKECADDDDSDDTIDFVGDTNSWPPNHREVTATIFARGDEAEPDDEDPTTQEDPADTVVISSVTASSSDGTFVAAQGEDWGYGDPTVDNGTAQTEVWTIRERAGGTDQTETDTTDSGRTIRITVTATFSDGDDTSCTATFCTRTPHDMRKGNRTWTPCQAAYDSAEETAAES